MIIVIAITNGINEDDNDIGNDDSNGKPQPLAQVYKEVGYDLLAKAGHCPLLPVFDWDC